jgi:hypothetical protein
MRKSKTKLRTKSRRKLRTKSRRKLRTKSRRKLRTKSITKSRTKLRTKLRTKYQNDSVGIVYMCPYCGDLIGTSEFRSKDHITKKHYNEKAPLEEPIIFPEPNPLTAEPLELTYEQKNYIMSLYKPVDKPVDKPDSILFESLPTKRSSIWFESLPK